MPLGAISAVVSQSDRKAYSAIGGKGLAPAIAPGIVSTGASLPWPVTSACMTATDEFLRNAEAYAATFDKGDLRSKPAKKVAVVACMDARLNPYGILGLSEGDAHVIRNAGGVVTDEEIRSLAISQHMLGTEEIMLIHHTDCGMLTYTEHVLRDGQRAELLVGDDATRVAVTWASPSLSPRIPYRFRRTSMRATTATFLAGLDRRSPLSKVAA